MILDSHLTYDNHISQLVSSCLSKLVQINRVKNCFDKETLTLMINSLVFSKMFYCSSVWSNTSASNIKKLQLIQNFAAKIITKSGKFDHATPLLRQLNWLPVKEQLHLRDATMTFKCANNLAPDYLCSSLIQRNKIHKRETRNKNSMHIPLFKTAAGQRSFIYRATKIWNNTEQSLKLCSSVKNFKKALKDRLLIQVNSD